MDFLSTADFLPFTALYLIKFEAAINAILLQVLGLCPQTAEALPLEPQSSWFSPYN